MLALKGSGDLAQPLSAQAQPPRRPSGADKKQKPANKQGGHGRSRNRFGTSRDGRFPVNSILFAANQHCQTLWKSDSRPKPLTVRCRRSASAFVLDEKCGPRQCQKSVRWVDVLSPGGGETSEVRSPGRHRWSAATSGIALPLLHRHCERSEAIQLPCLLTCCSMDCFAALAMTLKHNFAISPHHMREAFVYFPALWEQRAQGMPGGRCAQ